MSTPKSRKKPDAPAKKVNIVNLYNEIRDSIINVSPEILKVEANKTRAAARRARKVLQDVMKRTKDLRKALLEETRKA